MKLLQLLFKLLGIIDLYSLYVLYLYMHMHARGVIPLEIYVDGTQKSIVSAIISMFLCKTFHKL